MAAGIPPIWIRDARQYLLEVRAEFRKITWPPQQEYVGGTIGVIVIVAILSLLARRARRRPRCC